MSKLHIGDYVYVEYYHKNAILVGDRGGIVGRWLIKMDEGETFHVSSRDCTIIRYGHPCSVTGDWEMLEERFDRLLDYLGLGEITKPQTTVIRKIKGKK